MGFKIADIGVVLSDLLPAGPPANFACHIRALGAKACPVRWVGSREFGIEVLSKPPGAGHRGRQRTDISAGIFARSPALRTSRKDSSE